MISVYAEEARRAVISSPDAIAGASFEAPSLIYAFFAVAPLASKAFRNRHPESQWIADVTANEAQRAVVIDDAREITHVG